MLNGNRSHLELNNSKVEDDTMAMRDDTMVSIMLASCHHHRVVVIVPLYHRVIVLSPSYHHVIVTPPSFWSRCLVMNKRTLLHLRFDLLILFFSFNTIFGSYQLKLWWKKFGIGDPVKTLAAPFILITQRCLRLHLASNSHPREEQSSR